jgi:hypothetical protein
VARIRCVHNNGKQSEFHLLWRRKLDRYTLPVVAVQGLDHDRIADAFGAIDGVAAVMDLPLPRHRQARVTQGPVGLLLV